MAIRGMTHEEHKSKYVPHIFLYGLIGAVAFYILFAIMGLVSGKSSEWILFYSWLASIVGYILSAFAFYLYKGGWKNILETINPKLKARIHEEQADLVEELMGIVDRIPVEHRRQVEDLLAQIYYGAKASKIIGNGPVMVRNGKLIIDGKEYDFDPKKISSVLKNWLSED